jgi:precorrin-2 dehydrogenase/sirohydrochlorin ferrochelatase
MSFYPICLDLEGRACVVIGGGRVAARKVLGLLSCSAQVSVISPELTEELLKQYKKGNFEWIDREYCQGDLKQAFLVIAATDNEEIQQKIYEEAVTYNILLNVADVPQRCNFILPATARQGDLMIAISTSGKSPALARKLRIELEKKYGAEYRVLVDILGAIRPEILVSGQQQADNEELFNQLLHDRMVDWIRTRDWPSLENHFAKVLGDRVGDDWIQKIRPFYA